MRTKLILIGAVTSCLLMTANVAVADGYESQHEARGNPAPSTHGLSLKQQTLSHGDFFLLFDNTGMPVTATDLADCSALPVPLVLRVRGTFDYYDGVCDDASPRGCNGKLLYRTEFCVAAFQAQAEFAGRILSQFGRARTRICYDRDGDGECIASETVASGFVTIQDQALFVNGEARVPTREIGIRTLTDSRPFRFEGRTVRIPRNGTLVNVLLDLPPGFPNTPITPDACIGGPCGFAASGVSVGR